MNVPSNLRYTQDHEWAGKDENLLTIGITDFAQSELGDIVFIELPAIGTHFAANDVFGTVEAVKAVSELFMPVAGTIVAVNDALNNSPEEVNSSPYDKGWMIKIEPDNMADWDALMSADDYTAAVS